MRVVLASSLALALLACKQPKPDLPAQDTAEVAAPEQPSAEVESAKPESPAAEADRREPRELAAIPGADEPGPIYFVINTRGVARLDEAGITMILDKPERHVQDLLLGPDGGAYLLDARSLRRITGDALIEVARFGYDDVAPVDALGLAPDGTPWIANNRGVATLVDGRWRERSRAELGIARAEAIAVGFDGAVWVAGTRKLLRREPGGEGAWTPVDLAALGPVPLLLHLRASPDDTVVATTGKQLLRFGDAGAPAIVELEAPEGVGYTAELEVAVDGSIALASSGCELVVVAPTNAQRRVAAERYACETLEAMTVDGRGRLWVAAREGLSVIDPGRGEGGEVLVEYPTGAFPELGGRVGHMLALGRGPALPEVPAIATATITGRLLIDGQPLNDAAIELCPTAELVREGSPCSRAKSRFEGRTDGHGKFRVEGVAIGDYSFAVEVDGQWRWTTPPSFAAELRPGGAHDVGALTLAKF